MNGRQNFDGELNLPSDSLRRRLHHGRKLYDAGMGVDHQ